MPPADREALETLLEVGRLLSSKLELSELLTTVLELAARVVGSESASLLLFDEKTQELHFDVALGLGARAESVRLKLGQGIAGAVAASRKPELINDVRKDPRWSPAMDEATGFVTRSVMAVPMTLKGRLVGVLEAINGRGGAFQEADLRVFEAFASQAAVAIENARLFTSLSDERRKLATVFSQMSDGAVLADASGAVLLANDAAARLLGGAPASLPEAFAAAGLKATPALPELLAGDGEAAFAAVRQEPTFLVLEGKARPAPGEDGVARLLVFRDGTESWRQEKLKRTFLSLISHKLRTPLAAVTGFAEILLGELDPDDALAFKAARTIREQGQKVSGLVEKLLHYTLLESPDLQIKPEPFLLDEAVAEALRSLKESLEAREAQIDAPPTRLTVVADRALVTEAIKNLLDNAVKFNAGPKPAAALRARAEGDWAALTVADTGPGIPPEDHEKVFSRFHQVEKDFTGQQDGIGLGLAFVRRVAELHGGEATLRSKLGAGTSVTITLPRPRAA